MTAVTFAELMLAFFDRVSCPTRPEHFIIIAIVLRDQGPDSGHQYGFLESMTTSAAPVAPRFSWDPGKTRDAFLTPAYGRMRGDDFRRRES